ncbi:hypothetical protein, partial [Yersinia enterocolitica]|uniref:hypothetical protein n=1 Tax=Yersinia enterocolitica TaxID=630 RepID=UPI001E5EF5D2
SIFFFMILLLRDFLWQQKNDAATLQPFCCHLPNLRYKKTASRRLTTYSYYFVLLVLFSMVPGAGLEPAQP